MPEGRSDTESGCRAAHYTTVHLLFIIGAPCAINYGDSHHTRVNRVRDEHVRHLDPAPAILDQDKQWACSAWLFY